MASISDTIATLERSAIVYETGTDVVFAIHARNATTRGMKINKNDKNMTSTIYLIPTIIIRHCNKT